MTSAGRPKHAHTSVQVKQLCSSGTEQAPGGNGLKPRAVVINDNQAVNEPANTGRQTVGIVQAPAVKYAIAIQ